MFTLIKYLLNEMRILIKYFYKTLIDSWQIMRNWDYEIISEKQFLKEKSLPYQNRIIFDESGELDPLGGLNLEDRGRDNLMKKRYYSALDKEKVDKYYRPIIREQYKNFFSKESNESIKKGERFISKFQDLCYNMYFLIHAGRNMDSSDKKNIDLFLNNLKNPENRSIFNILYDLIIHRLNLNNMYKDNDYIVENALENSIIYHWKKAGLDKMTNLTLEMIHNYIPFVMFHVFICKFSIDLIIKKEFNISDIPDEDEEYDKNNFTKLDKFVFEIFRYASTVDIITSKLNNYDELNQIGKFLGRDNICFHNLKDINHSELNWKNAKKFDPTRFDDVETTKNNVKEVSYNKDEIEKEFYKTNKNTLCPIKNNLIEQKGYAPFGLGYRRCPGEFLNYGILKEFLLALKEYKPNFNYDNNEDNVLILPNKIYYDNIILQ